MDTIPLENMRTGETGQIAWVDGQASFVTRLAEMGLREGAVVSMVQPGSPCILALNGQRLSMRVDEETQIFVELTKNLTFSH